MYWITVTLRIAVSESRRSRRRMEFDGNACGRRIAALRKNKGLTQEQLADALNISWSLLSKTEIGKREITIGLLCSMVNYFHVPADYILYGEENLCNSRDTRMREIVEELNQLWFHK